jgi:flagellar biosynthesis/type III secretory pathway protein FliH
MHPNGEVERGGTDDEHETHAWAGYIVPQREAIETLHDRLEAAEARVRELEEELDVDIEKENAAFWNEAQAAYDSGHHDGYREGYEDGLNHD